MREYNVHNVRFYDHQPGAIHCLAYNNALKLLALSRADGSIELWDCQSKPFKRDTLIGQPESSVESLVWCDSRLFSAGLNGFIVEYAIPGFLQKNQVAVTGGPTWCMALSPNRKFLATGTEGGYVCIFEVCDDGLLYHKIVNKQRNRILSIGWHSDSDHIVTGSVNYVHLISCKTEQTMQFPVSKESTSKETIVWCVAVLDDMTIVTGDSRGFTSFWDGSYGTAINVIQTHQADVLTMQVNPDLCSVYVAGVDPVIVEVRLVDSSSRHRCPKMWVKSVQRKIHSHDIRALAVTQEGKLFSGGVDTYLALSYYPPRTAIKYPATPPKGYISIAKKSHSLLLGYKNRIELWRLGRCSPDEEYTDKFLPVTEDRMKLVEIELKSSERLEFCALSPTAKHIAYIVRGKIKIYTFTPPEECEGGRLEKLRCCSTNLQPSRSLKWLDEDRLISATHSSGLQVLTVNEVVSVESDVPLPDGGGVQDMASSEDGSYLAVLEYNNFVTIFATGKNSFKEISTLKSRIPVTSFAMNKDQIVIAYSNSGVAECDIKTGHLSPFGKLINNALGEIKLNNVFQNISFKDPDYIFLHSVSSFYVLNRNADQSGESAAKVMRFGVDTESNDSVSPVKTCSDGLISTIRRPNHILYFSHLDNNDLISIENNPIWLLDSLPPALKVKKFGAA